MADPTIRADQLSRTYGSGSSAVHALKAVDFEIAPAQKVAIVGKSGSGKSTLMNLLGGLDHPSGGRLHVAGHDLADLSRRQLAHYRLHTVGFIFQSFHLIGSRTARENVELPLMLAGWTRRDRRARAHALLGELGLGARADHPPMQLSGGERQRVAIARALALNPSLLLADEPTGNLDTGSAAMVMEMIADQVRRQGVTLIVVTHDQDLASRHADRTIRMLDGSIVPE